MHPGVEPPSLETSPDRSPPGSILTVVKLPEAEQSAEHPNRHLLRVMADRQRNPCGTLSHRRPVYGFALGPVHSSAP